MANYVQGGNASGTSAAPAVTLAAAPTEGNLLTAIVVTAQDRTQVANPDWIQIPGPNDRRSCAYWRVVLGDESATKTPCAIASGAWQCQVAEYAGNILSSPLLVSGNVGDTSSPVDLSAINPADNKPAILVGMAIASGNAPTWNAQSIGGVAATERLDAQAGATSATLFDRLDVDTATSTFAAQATASSNPDKGAIYLLIYEAIGAITGAAAGAAASIGAAAGSVYKTGVAAGAAHSAGAANAVVRYAGVAAGAAVSAGMAISRTLDEAGSVAFSEAVRGSAVLSLAVRGELAMSEAVLGSVTVSVAPLEVA